MNLKSKVIKEEILLWHFYLFLFIFYGLPTPPANVVKGNNRKQEKCHMPDDQLLILKSTGKQNATSIEYLEKAIYL